MENLPNRFQKLITWADKVFSFISQWNFYNFISQPLELVVKLTVKMAFSHRISRCLCSESVQSEKMWPILQNKDQRLRPSALVPVSLSGMGASF